MGAVAVDVGPRWKGGPDLEILAGRWETVELRCDDFLK